MKLQVLSDPDSIARAGASHIAAAASSAIAAHGRFVLAVSGGHTPWAMLGALARRSVAWDQVHVVQVDERVVPKNHPDRNLKHLRESLFPAAPLPPENLHAMPVEEIDLGAAAEAYAGTVIALAGDPPTLDLIHLGLGADGHTASLVPDDPVLDIVDRPVAVTGPYRGRRRMTLTYPVLDRARSLLFVVTGEEKADALSRLFQRDPAIPAARILSENILVIADRAAAKGVKHDQGGKAVPSLPS